MMNECKDKYVYSKCFFIKHCKWNIDFPSKKSFTHIFVFEQGVEDGLGDMANKTRDKTYIQKVAV